MDYRIFNLLVPKGICWLGAIRGVPDWAKVHRGDSQAGRFPDDAYYEMSPNHPKDIKLADALWNTNGFLVISERLLDFLSGEKALKNNEVFDVAIVNHKGRRERAKYFIVHQVNRPTCADKKKSVGVWSAIDSSTYASLEKLVLVNDAIDPEAVIFRPAEFSERALFRSDLAEKVLAGAFTGGIEFFNLDQFNEM
jgi:hypothetical protein